MISWEGCLQGLSINPRATRPTRSRPAVEGLEDRTLLATYTVIDTSDGAGVLTLVNKNTQAYTVTSLRRAIEESNKSANVLDTIDFNIKGAPVFTPGKAFLTITDPVVIDGTTQPGYDAKKFLAVVTLDGTKAK